MIRREKITSNEQFLRTLSQAQEPIDKQIKNLESLENKIADYIKKRIKENITFYFGGSKVRNTMLKEKFDSNIIVYWPSNSEKEPHEIHAKLGKVLKKRYSKPQPKNLGWEILRKEKNTFHVDVIPGILIDPTGGMANFYNTITGEPTETSLKAQDEYVQKSERIEIIRLMKLWKHRREVPINTFLLELMTIAACRGINRTQLEKQAMKVFHVIEERIVTKFSDPANQNNDLSQINSISEKARTKELVLEAINSKTWNKVFKR